MTMNDSLFMRRAIQLARLGAGNVSPNPLVGAVIVIEGRVVGEGFHRQYGAAHAEVEAVQRVSAADLPSLAEATLYVTLEPCFHQGKTPPCVDLVLKHRFERVVIACLDPNPLVAGQSVGRLRAAGVEVVTGILESEARQLAAAFLTAMTQKRPYIILKWAQSGDGFIGKPKEQVWLTNAFSKRLVHKWRSEVATIAVGATTLRVDNPRLDTRLWSGKSPARVVWLRETRGIEPYHFFDPTNAASTFLITPSASKFIENRPHLNQKTLDFDSATFLQDVMAYLHEQHLDSILIEGGAKTLQAFIDADFWDEARVFTAPLLLHQGVAAPVFSRSPEHIEAVGNDKLAYYFNKKDKNNEK